VNQKKKSSWNWTSLFTQLKSEQGFSLAEVMVAAGMLGILSLGVTQLMQNSSKTEKRLSQQINLVQLEAEIRNALTDSVACGRTFRAVQLDQNLAAQNPPVARPAGQAALQVTTAFQNLPTSGGQSVRIYKGNNPAEGDPVNWQTVIQLFDEGVNPPVGVYGNGSNRISVRSIQAAGYVEDSWGGIAVQPGDLNLATTSAIAGSPNAYGTVLLRVMFVRGADTAALTDEQKRIKAANSTYGSVLVPRYFKVNVIVDAGNRVQDCYTQGNQFVEAYCGALGGNWDAAIGRCTNINVEHSATVGTTDWNITANKTQAGAGNGGEAGLASEGALMVGLDVDAGGALAPADIGDGNAYIFNGLVVGDRASGNFVGSVAIPNPLSGIGAGDAFFARHIMVGRNAEIGNNANVANNLNVTNNATVTNNTFLRNNLRVGAGNSPAPYNGAGDASVENQLQVGGQAIIGTPGTPLAGVGDATIGNNLNVRSNTSIGQTTINTNHMLTVAGDSALFSNGTSNLFVNNNNASDSDVRINQEANVPFRIDESGTQVMRVLNTGEIQIYSGGTVRTSIGAGTTAAYRPVIIRNQPYTNNNTHFDIPNSEVGYEAATKYWVRRMIYGSLYEGNQSKIEDILNNMADYAQHNRLDALIGSVCTDMQLQVGNTGYRANCALISGQCVCNQSDCSHNTGVRVCNNMTLAGNFRADGNVTAGGNLVAGGSGNIGSSLVVGTTINAGGTITAPRVDATDWSRADRIYIRSLSEPGAGYIKGTYLWATTRMTSPRVCSSAATGGTNNSACYTRFGKVTCDGGGFIIGIAYGRPICALSGENTGSTIGVTWH